MFACDTTESWNARYAAYLASGSSSGFVVNLRALLEPLAASLRERGIDVCVETALGNPLHQMLLDHIRRSNRIWSSRTRIITPCYTGPC